MQALTLFEEKYINLLTWELSSSDFEKWIYNEKTLETFFTQDIFTSILSLDYSTPSFKYSLRILVEWYVDNNKVSSLVDTREMIKSLTSIMKRDGNEISALQEIYNFYCDWYDFLRDLAMNYGLPSFNIETNDKLLQNIYPDVSLDAEIIINHIISWKIRLSWTRNEVGGYMEYIEIKK